jgi:hypothetical protein
MIPSFNKKTNMLLIYGECYKNWQNSLTEQGWTKVWMGIILKN